MFVCVCVLLSIFVHTLFFMYFSIVSFVKEILILNHKKGLLQIAIHKKNYCWFRADNGQGQDLTSNDACPHWFLYSFSQCKTFM